MRTHRPFALLLAIALVVLAACGTAPPVADEATDAPEPDDTAVTEDDGGEEVAATEAASPTPEPPTATPEPSATPSPTPPPMSEVDVSLADDGSVFRARWNRGELRRMHWASDDELIVTASNAFFRYDIASGTETKVVDSGQPVLTVGDSDTEFVVEDQATGERLATLAQTEEMLVFRHQFSSNYAMLTAFQDAKVFLWDAVTGERLPDLEMPRTVRSVMLSDDGERVAVEWGEVDAVQIEVFETRSGEQVWGEETNIVDFVQSYRFSPSGDLLMIAGKMVPAYSNILIGPPVTQLVDLVTGESAEVTSIERQSSDVAPSQVFIDETQVLVSHGSTVSLLDTATTEVIASYEMPFGVRRLALSPDGGTIAVSNLAQIVIWDLDADAQLGAFTGYATDVAFNDISPDSTRAAAVIAGRLQILDLTSGAFVLDSETVLDLPLVKPAGDDDADYLSIAGFGPVAHTLLVDHGDDLVLVDYEADAEVWRRAGALSRMSVDRTRLLLRGEESAYEVVDSTTGEALVSLEVPEQCGLATTDDLRLLAAAVKDEGEQTIAEIAIFELTTGTALGALGPVPGQCSAEIDFSPSGTLLAGIFGTTNATVWDVGSLSEVTTFRHGHASINFFGITDIQSGTPEFLTDELLATTGGGWDDDEYYTWMMPGGTQIGSFETSSGRHAYSADGSQLVIAETGVGVAQLLNPLTGETRRLFYVHDNTINGIVISRDGRYMLTTSMDGTVVVQRLPDDLGE